MRIVSQNVTEDFMVLDYMNQPVANIPLSQFTYFIYDNNGNNVSNNVLVTFQELGTGHYRATFVPTTKGTWLLTVYHPTYFPWGKTNSIDIYDNDIDTTTILIKRILGLTQENFHIDNNMYDSSQRLMSSRIRLYNDSLSIGSDLNILATYNISIVYNNDGTLQTYTVFKI